MKLLHSGKVRDVYEDGDDLVLVASDRVSVYDVVLPTPIPEKGAILTALSLWWFDQLGDVMPNHLTADQSFPEEFAGRAMRCRKLDMLPVEFIVRGFLTGGGYTEYTKTGGLCGLTLPAGIPEAGKLDPAIFTPSTKAPMGQHDESMTYEEVVDAIGEARASRGRELSLDIYRKGAEIAAKNGVIIADTKFEIGLDATGEMVLADEVLTPDSSRFWDAATWSPGSSPNPLDKQFVRNFAANVPGWNKTAPGPELPADVVEATRARYIDVYQRITGKTWQ